MRSLTKILREIAEGTRNEVGDYWSLTYCEEAADRIESLIKKVKELEDEIQVRKDNVNWK